MPRDKKKVESSDDSDSGPDDRTPAAKKPKTSASESSKKGSSGDNGETSWEIGRNRFLELKEFKGKWYVSIREFYSDNGEMKPGKKGIMLTMEQWRSLRSHVDDLDEAIKRNV